MPRIEAVAGEQLVHAQHALLEPHGVHVCVANATIGADGADMRDMIVDAFQLEQTVRSARGARRRLDSGSPLDCMAKRRGVCEARSPEMSRPVRTPCSTRQMLEQLFGALMR